jgi:hypothetical protein
VSTSTKPVTGSPGVLYRTSGTAVTQQGGYSSHLWQPGIRRPHCLPLLINTCRLCIAAAAQHMQARLFHMIRRTTQCPITLKSQHTMCWCKKSNKFSQQNAATGTKYGMMQPVTAVHRHNCSQESCSLLTQHPLSTTAGANAQPVIASQLGFLLVSRPVLSVAIDGSCLSRCCSCTHKRGGSISALHESVKNKVGATTQLGSYDSVIQASVAHR